MPPRQVQLIASCGVVAAVGIAPGCSQHASVEHLRQAECHTVAAPPDAVFAAARAYYEVQGYTISVVDTNARLVSAYRSQNREAPIRREIVWVRPSPAAATGAAGSSDLRIRAVWGLDWLEWERPAALAREFEAIALGRKQPSAEPTEELPR